MQVVDEDNFATISDGHLKKKHSFLLLESGMKYS